MPRPLQRLAAVVFVSWLSLFVAGLFLAPAATSQRPAAAESEPPALPVAHNLKQLNLHADRLVLSTKEALEQVRVFARYADVAASSASFAEDEAQLRAALADAGGTVLAETRHAGRPHNAVTLRLSVAPERFDALLLRLSNLGTLDSVTTRYLDRTDEFRQLIVRARQPKTARPAQLNFVAAQNLVPAKKGKVQLAALPPSDDASAAEAELRALFADESRCQLSFTLRERPPTTAGETAFRRSGDAILWALPWVALSLPAIVALASLVFSVRVILPQRPTLTPAADAPTQSDA